MGPKRKKNLWDVATFCCIIHIFPFFQGNARSSKLHDVSLWFPSGPSAFKSGALVGRPLRIKCCDFGYAFYCHRFLSPGNTAFSFRCQGQKSRLCQFLAMAKVSNYFDFRIACFKFDINHISEFRPCRSDFQIQFCQESSECFWKYVLIKNNT